jgi:hypothetical protein
MGEIGMNSTVANGNKAEMTAPVRGGFALAVPLFFFTVFAAGVAVAQGVSGNQNVPVPAIAQPLAPPTVTPGTSAFTLRVNGTGFTPTSVVNWNGAALATTYVNGNELQAAVPSEDVAEIGSAAIVVINNATPHPKVSGTVYFPINTPLTAVNFSPASYPTGTNPTGVVLADVNNDGILDMVICNDYDNTISVLLGNADGTFQPQTTFPAYGFPYNIFAGDFNNDGILDLVTVDKRKDAISVFLGNGDGTFQHYRNFATQGDPLSLNIGDFNGDGNLDVVTVNSSADTISVFLGYGDGTFQKAINIPAGAEPTDVTVGDFNGDGIPDLAVADSRTGYAAVLIGNGDGTFKHRVNYTTGGGPNAIHTADLNKDGKLDLITTNAVGTVSVLLGNGDGTFQPATTLQGESFPAYAIATYDFNSDGNVDIMVAELNDDELTLYLGNGDGTFQPAVNYPVLMHPDAFAVADFNNDGRLDMAVADETSNMVTILSQTTPLILNPVSLAFGPVMIGQTSNPQSSTLTNASSSPVTISGIALGGKNANLFSQTNDCPATLDAGQFCTITATFTPRTVGAKSASVNITDGTGLQALILTGTGVH